MHFKIKIKELENMMKHSFEFSIYLLNHVMQIKAQVKCQASHKAN